MHDYIINIIMSGQIKYKCNNGCSKIIIIIIIRSSMQSVRPAAIGYGIIGGSIMYNYNAMQ